MLAELLDSIADQGLPDDIEIVVSDDASPDDTIAIAESYRSKLRHYTFIAQPTNLGSDRNFLAVVAAATGDFIWLMGDDDRIEPGGARIVLDALKRWPNAVGLTVGVTDYDKDMRNPVGVRKMPPEQLLTGAEAVFTTLGELLGYMSVLVVRRDLWQAHANDPAVLANDNYYIHVLIAGLVMGQAGQWGVIPAPCVGFRTGNDQLKTRYGWIERLRIDVRGYTEIAAILFPDNPAPRAALRRSVFDAHVLARIINAKTAPGNTEGLLHVLGYLLKQYGTLPRFWTRALPLLVAPKWTVRKARSTYKRHARSSGSHGL